MPLLVTGVSKQSLRGGLCRSAHVSVCSGEAFGVVHRLSLKIWSLLGKRGFSTWSASSKRVVSPVQKRVWKELCSAVSVLGHSLRGASRTHNSRLSPVHSMNAGRHAERRGDECRTPDLKVFRSNACRRDLPFPSALLWIWKDVRHIGSVPSIALLCLVFVFL
jgi:hypothetical protein